MTQARGSRRARVAGDGARDGRRSASRYGGRLSVDRYDGRCSANRFGCVTLLVLASLLVPASLVFVGTAAAAPRVTLKLTPIPIPGFPHTGDILGAGAEVEAEATISGSEYGGFPSPLTQLIIFAPIGVKVTATGFATCAPAVLEASGPTRCPKRSNAGPRGEGSGVVSFGGETVPEKVSIQAFFIPAGGLAFYVEGRTPASFQIVEKGHWTTAGAPFGPELITEVPLVESVPGANDASILSFKVRVGAAYRKGSRTVSYITLSKKCPRGGAPVKAELKFLSGETTTVIDDVPCPKQR
jgi:hypothetical protein